MNEKSSEAAVTLTNQRAAAGNTADRRGGGSYDLAAEGGRDRGRVQDTSGASEQRLHTEHSSLHTEHSSLHTGHSSLHSAGKQVFPSMPSTRSQGRLSPRCSSPDANPAERLLAPRPSDVSSVLSAQTWTPAPHRSRCRAVPKTSRRPAHPLSPRGPPPSSPGLQPRLPLSPRKRTGVITAVTSARPPRVTAKAEQGDSGLATKTGLRRELAGPGSPAAAPVLLTTTAAVSETTGSADGKSRSSRFREEEDAGGPAVCRERSTPPSPSASCPEAERASIRSFLEDKVLQRVPGSLYISGAPGTGRRPVSTVSCRHEAGGGADPGGGELHVLRSSHSIFPLLADKLKASGGQSGLQAPDGPGARWLLVLDEIDQLDSKLRTSSTPSSSGRTCPRIANALDLTDRILPRLQARPHCRPLLLHFPPYSRRSSAPSCRTDGHSSVPGKCRRCRETPGKLDICRRAVEIVESDERKKAADSKAEAKAARVSLLRWRGCCRRFMATGWRLRAAAATARRERVPPAAKLLVCCLLLLIRNGKSKEVVLGKVFLKIEEKDVENALKDRTLLGSILAAGLPS
ncbi:hypothetical protein INR49_018311 [Caranx melampygus]|nr:hypothetical protein INR49_018311 [Caranx melampygus]